jgi:hypothetical protein
MRQDVNRPKASGSSVERQILLCGLLVRRHCWSLSMRGKLLLAALCVTAGWLFVQSVHTFLTVNDGGVGDVMVVEGWIGSRPVGDEVARAMLRGHYKLVVVVKDKYDGGDKWTSGGYAADYVAADLAAHGVPKDLINTLFCPVVHKDRTYHCALATRQWLQQRGVFVQSVDVVTLASHSRRSRLLYQKAFTRQVKIRITALEDRDYDPAHWWRSSEGVKTVLSEVVAYIYARFFFWPAAC